MNRQTLAIALAAISLTLSTASADIVDGINWADAVAAHSENIQNYGGMLLSDDTTWWLTGLPDADINDNGYAWDAADQDTVAGWRSTNPDESFTLYWEAGLPDVEGNDLFVHYYGGPYAAAQVFASTDGEAYEYVGAISGGTPGFISEASLDFGGLFASDVHYVRVARTAGGPQTGMFFDAVGGNVPDTGGDLDGSGAIDINDVPHFIDALLANPPAHAGIDQSEADTNGDERIDGNDIQPFLHALIESA